MNQFKNAMTRVEVPKRAIGAGLTLLIGGGLIAAGISASIYNVEGGHRALKFNRIGGLRNKIYGEGTHFRLPGMEWPIIFDVRSKPRAITSVTGSKDLQMVNLTLRVLAKPNTSKLPEIYRRLGSNWDDRILPSVCHEVMKATVAQYNAAQLIMNRAEVSRAIRRRVISRCMEFDIVLDDVAIILTSTALQEAERARYLVERAQQEKRSFIVKALGEAKAAKMIAEAVEGNPGFIALRKIEAMREIAETLAKGQNRLFLSADSLLLDGSKDLVPLATENHFNQAMEKTKDMSLMELEELEKLAGNESATIENELEELVRESEDTVPPNTMPTIA